MKQLLIVSICILATMAMYAQNSNEDKASLALKNDDFTSALEYANLAVKENPNNNIAFLYRGIANLNLGEYALAISDFNVGLKNTKASQKQVKSIFYSFRAKVWLLTDEPTNALEDLNTAIKYDKKDISYYQSRGDLYSKMKKYDKAHSDYTSILKLDEFNPRAMKSIGEIYLAQQKFTDAEAILTKLIKLSPEYDKAYFHMARSKYEQKQFDQAIEFAFEAYSRNTDYDASRNLFFYYANKNHTLALSKMSFMISEQPDNPYWVVMRGDLKSQLKDFIGALEDYTTAYSMFEDDESKNKITHRRADAYADLELFKNALKEYTKYISYNPTNAYGFGSRAYCYQMLGEYDSAVQDLTKAIELDPSENHFYFRKGWILSEYLHDTKGGLECFTKSIDIDKNHPNSYLQRGRIYKHQKNEPVKAKADFEMVLLLDSVIKAVDNCRQYALLELGRKDEALEFMKNVLAQFPNKENYYEAACLYSLVNNTELSISSLEHAFENGFRSINHINADDDLNNVKKLPTFKAIIEKWKKVYQKEELEIKKLEIKEQTEVQENNQPITVTIPMKNKGNAGVYELACKINELPLNFIFDTGASDISISQTEVQFMLKNNYLKQSDIVGSQRYMDANGDITIGTKINLKKVEIGGYVLYNVAASVVSNKNAPLLFGQSALNQYSKITIDNKAKTLTISKNDK